MTVYYLRRGQCSRPREQLLQRPRGRRALGKCKEGKECGWCVPVTSVLVRQGGPWWGPLGAVQGISLLLE